MVSYCTYISSPYCACIFIFTLLKWVSLFFIVILLANLSETCHKNGLVVDIQIPKGLIALKNFEGEPRVRRNCIVEEIDLKFKIKSMLLASLRQVHLISKSISKAISSVWQLQPSWFDFEMIFINGKWLEAALTLSKFLISN